MLTDLVFNQRNSGIRRRERGKEYTEISIPKGSDNQTSHYNYFSQLILSSPEI